MVAVCPTMCGTLSLPPSLSCSNRWEHRQWRGVRLAHRLEAFVDTLPWHSAESNHLNRPKAGPTDDCTPRLPAQKSPGAIAATHAKIRASFSVCPLKARAGSTKHETRSTKHEARSTKHEARNTMHEARCTRHEARSTKHDARRTKHDARSTKHETRSTTHEARSTKHEARNTKHEARSTKHEARSTRSTKHEAGVVMVDAAAARTRAGAGATYMSDVGDALVFEIALAIHLTCQVGHTTVADERH